jgi:hypothetical protein
MLVRIELLLKNKVVEKYEAPAGSWIQSEKVGAISLPGLLTPSEGELKGYTIRFTPLNAKQVKDDKRLPSVRLINDMEFISSSGMTEEQMTFFRAFEADMRRILKSILKSHIKQMQMKRNHFEESGFFEMKDGGIWYFNTGDLRWFAKQGGMLLRTAHSFTDYTGGANRSIKYDEQFAENLLKEVRA